MILVSMISALYRHFSSMFTLGMFTFHAICFCVYHKKQEPISKNYIEKKNRNKIIIRCHAQVITLNIIIITAQIPKCVHT